MTETQMHIPLQDFILKVHGRCNLACAYCYVYESADQSWRTREKAMDDRTLAQAAMRIGEQARRFELLEVRAVLHGGEPLLIGAKGVGKVATMLTAAMPESCKLSISVQTNGTLLDRQILDTLRQHKIGVGVSVDGPQAVNDKFRMYRGGRGSFEDVARGITLLRDEFPDIYNGLLCTINPSTDPMEIYDALVAFKPPSLDLLLPHYNWSNLPPEHSGDTSATPYADWIIPLFDRWSVSSGGMNIRYLRSIIDLLLGGQSQVESIGLTPSAMLVIETDGTMEQVDSLKSTFDGAARTGLNIFEHSIAEAQLHPGVQVQQLGEAALSATCRKCPIMKVCGGGYYPHRWSEKSGFDNPSVYCADLKKLIAHAQLRLQQKVDELRAKANARQAKD